MATIYVNSGAGGANDGTSWTDAYTSLASTNTAAAGDVVKVHNTHSESGLTSSINWSNGTVSNPVRVVCVNKDASDAVSTGGSVAFNSAGVGPQGNVYVRGLSLSQATGVFQFGPATNGYMELDTCTVSTTANAAIRPSGSSSRAKAVWRNCTVDFTSGGGTSVSLALDSTQHLFWEFLGGSVTMRSSQTNFLMLSTGPTCKVKFAGVSFSGTVTNLFNSSVNSGGTYEFVGCTAPTYTNVFSSAPTNYQCRVNLDGLKSGTLTAPLLPPVLQSDLTGTVAASLSRYRTGGADDGEQANAHSWEMAANATANDFIASLVSPPIARWVDTGSQTVTVYVASGTTLQDDEFWIEVFSPSEAGTATAQAKYQSTRAAPLATPANLTTDGTSTWNGSNVGTKQKVSVSINPTIPGVVVAKAHLAKASTTVYVDPQLDIA